MIQVKCDWEICVRESSRLVATYEFPNFLTELGEAHIAARLSGSPTQMSHMAVGTGTGQDQADQTLATEIARVALEATYPLQGSGADDNRVAYYAIFPAGTGTGTLTEFAIFNASSGGVMLNYATGFTPIVKGAGQSFEITAYLKIGTT
jgi:hypothetical protein